MTDRSRGIYDTDAGDRPTGNNNNPNGVPHAAPGGPPTATSEPPREHTFLTRSVPSAVTYSGYNPLHLNREQNQSLEGSSGTGGADSGGGLSSEQTPSVSLGRTRLVTPTTRLTADIEAGGTHHTERSEGGLPGISSGSTGQRL